MKKNFQLKLIPLLALGAGLLGMLLRHWLLSAGIDQKGFVLPEHPANIACFVLTGVVLIGTLLCLRAMPAKTPYRAMFPPSAFSALGSWIAAAGICFTAFSEMGQNTDLISRICTIIGIAATICLIAVSFLRLKGIRPNAALHSIVTIYLMLHLVCQYRHWNSETQLTVQFFRLMASVFLMLGSYHLATLDAGMGKRKPYLFFWYGALFFCCLSIEGDNKVFYATMAIWTALCGCSFESFRQDAAMDLPKAVEQCLERLNDAGFEAYVVGGCVRDSLLGLTPHDYDMCTNASPRQIRKIFADCQQVRSGEKHGTIGVIADHQVYEITTFRTEGDYSDRRHPDWVKFVKDVRDDLARRDFTVNAMAYSPVCGYVDPFGGQNDLSDGVLRTVGDPTERFTEDALRILRGARFAARYQLTPHPETEAAMVTLAHSMDSLAQERIYSELCKLLECARAEDLIRYAPVIVQVIPELAASVGFEQHNPHHSYDVYTHTAHVVENTPPELSLRWAALLHDSGKPATFTLDESGCGHFYDHAPASAQIADTVLQRLRAPTALRQQVVFLVQQHMLYPELDKKLLRRRASKFGMENMKLLLQLQRADFCSKGNDEQSQYFAQLEDLLDQIAQDDACLTTRDLAVDGNDLLALGLEAGPALGEILDKLLEMVLDEQIPNEKDALLSVIKEELL